MICPWVASRIGVSTSKRVVPNVRGYPGKIGRVAGEKQIGRFVGLLSAGKNNQEVEEEEEEGGHALNPKPTTLHLPPPTLHPPP